MTINLGILASGNGSNVQAILDAIQKGSLDAEIRLLVCNKQGAKVMERAEKNDIPFVYIDHTQYSSREEYDTVVVQELLAEGVDTVVLAGYMRLITSLFLQAFPQRVLNIHPAILPSFSGTHGSADALAYGVKVSGCTVHFVSEEMDAGPVIIQAIVPVMQEDSAESLQARIHSQEHKIYPQALQWLAQERLFIQGRTVHVKNMEQNVSQSFTQDAFISPPLDLAFR